MVMKIILAQRVAVPANHEYPTVAGTVVYIVWIVYVLLVYIVAVPANHEYPTVAVTVVYLVWLVYVLLPIGIA